MQLESAVQNRHSFKHHVTDLGRVSNSNGGPPADLGALMATSGVFWLPSLGVQASGLKALGNSTKGGSPRAIY